MKAMILAAGLGTRLKEITATRPKALVELGGKPMLERVIARLKEFGADYIVVNTHHFSEMVKDFVSKNTFGVDVRISDETDMLLNTGGGLANAYPLLNIDSRPVLVHNVDILSNADFNALMDSHEKSGNDITLLTSGRSSDRRLLFDSEGTLRGWHNSKSDEYRPAGFVRNVDMKEEAFSGIYVASMNAVEKMHRRGAGIPFPLMDYLLENPDMLKIGRYFDSTLQLIDIGKPATLTQAREIFNDSQK